MLTSVDIKYYSSLKQKKYRDKERKFLIEGFHLIEECLKSDYSLECIIISDDNNIKKTEEIKEEISKRKIPLYFIKKYQYKKLSETDNSQGILAIVNKKDNNPVEVESLKLIVALDKINDPGNLGTIIRTSYWFDVNALLLSKNSVDLYNSKVIRSTQGALFHLKIYEDRNLIEDLFDFHSNKFEILLFTPWAIKELNNCSFLEKCVFVFGNETEGISPDIMNKRYEKVKIKNYSNCESLNVAVSCGIALNSLRLTSH